MPIVHKVRAELRPKGLDGISEEQIDQHWSLYEGYVKNANLLEEKIAERSKKNDFGPEFSELCRRLGFERDGVILHEHYFSALKAGGTPLDDAAELTKLLKESFGGFDDWRRQFAGMGRMRGVGWVILYYDPHTKGACNHWIELHQSGHPAGCAPLLVMDVWEHAYMVDWGAGGRADYVETFLRNVDWETVESQLKDARRLSTV